MNATPKRFAPVRETGIRAVVKSEIAEALAPLWAEIARLQAALERKNRSGVK
jgi:uncharacterized small protein (DUF1192 family)